MPGLNDRHHQNAHFDPLKNSDEQKFLYNDHFEIGTFDGYIKTPDDFAFIAPTLECAFR
jgi:hypothetical protein